MLMGVGRADGRSVGRMVGGTAGRRSDDGSDDRTYGLPRDVALDHSKTLLTVPIMCYQMAGADMFCRLIHSSPTKGICREGIGTREGE